MTNVLAASVWNPSEGIDLGFFVIRFYSLMFVVAFGLGWFITKKIYDREHIAIEKLDTLFIWTVLATLLGARLGHVFFYDWDYFSQHPTEILLPFKFEPEFRFTGFQGLASHGAAIAVIITMYFYAKKIVHKPILWVLDRVALPVASGGIFVRIGNFFNSEIIGKQTDSALGLKFIRDQFNPSEAMGMTGISNPNDAYNAIATDPKFAVFLNQVPARHPAQIYEAVGYVIVFAILMFMYWKTDARQRKGLIFGVFLVLLWSVRFLVEYVKESQGGFESDLGLFSTGQWLSIPFILAGLYLIFFAEKPIRGIEEE
ncbi:prolipoprotein diacylglyceryl transferase [Flavobacterium selenitireducens]|uniref:prolipoprotein diacylglyceryl transferase n=1 Tax=Flavobacterium selenitireducens TaxID=2722704 RepID=UPI00168B0AFA|nr:prolipoprotein diacylglyceryl transferase [Flavobacterium selenitireducens]MBD3582691.1 prolipoprotein diacylglyceryl transferase [Flavobacterium selenitireducens]